MTTTTPRNPLTLPDLLYASPSPPSRRINPGSINLPSFLPHLSVTPARTPQPPQSPSTPTTPTDSTYFPTLSASLHEPWNVRVASARKTPRLRQREASASTLAESADEDTETLVESTDLPSIENFVVESRMSSAALKRKVVIMGSPSVGASCSIHEQHAPVPFKGQTDASRIGKTSLTQQYVTPPSYNESYYPTIEATSHKSVMYEGIEYDCEIVDSAGQVIASHRAGDLEIS